MIDTVLLDFYGTLAVYGDMESGEALTWRQMYDSLAERNPALEYAAFVDTWRSVYAASLAPGELSAESVFFTKIERLGTRCGVPLDPEAIRAIGDRCLATWHRYITFPVELHRVLRALRRRYRLGLVSNFDHPAYLRRLLRDVELEPYLDAVVISGEVGYDKPHPAIFRRALERLGARPERTLFVGDHLVQDIEGARAVGCRTVLIDRHDRYPDHDGERVREISALVEVPHVSGGAP